MSEREIWFVTPPKSPWNFVEPVHPKGWIAMGLFIAGILAVPAVFVILILRTLNPIWTFGIIAGPLLVLVAFFLVVNRHVGRREAPVHERRRAA